MARRSGYVEIRAGETCHLCDVLSDTYWGFAYSQIALCADSGLVVVVVLHLRGKVLPYRGRGCNSVRAKEDEFQFVLNLIHIEGARLRSIRECESGIHGAIA